MPYSEFQTEVISLLTLAVWVGVTGFGLVLACLGILVARAVW